MWGITFPGLPIHCCRTPSANINALSQQRMSAQWLPFKSNSSESKSRLSEAGKYKSMVFIASDEAD